MHWLRNRTDEKNTEHKGIAVSSFKISPQDTGSVELQVAMLTANINHLNEHLKVHRKDNATKMGLIKKVGQRRSFLSYLENRDHKRYNDLVERLGLRK